MYGSFAIAFLQIQLQFWANSFKQVLAVLKGADQFYVTAGRFGWTRRRGGAQSCASALAR